VPIVVEEMTKSFVGWDRGEVDEASKTPVGPVGVRIGVPMTVGPLGLSVEDVCGLGSDALPFLKYIYIYCLLYYMYDENITQFCCCSLANKKKTEKTLTTLSPVDVSVLTLQ